jgi:branched-subunit amino acid ABC-type transport system permease component
MGILILSLFLNGIGLGLVYAAVAIGFSLVLGVSGVINFSHGIMYAFGAYFFWILYGNIGFWPALAITPVFVAIIGFVIERALVRRVYGLDPLFGLVITLGFATAMEEVIRMIFGPAAYSVSPFLCQGDFSYRRLRLSSVPALHCRNGSGHAGRGVAAHRPNQFRRSGESRDVQ